MSSTLKQTLLTYTNDQIGKDGFYPTEINDLVFMRSDQQTMPRYGLYKPTLCINVQGAKQVIFGGEVFDYGEMQYLVVSVDLPMIGHVTAASASEPFLGVILELDVNLLREVIEQLGTASNVIADTSVGVFVGDFEPRLADCLLRLTELLEQPQAIPVLYTSIIRELYYWLLTSPHGAAIAQLALPNSQTQRIAKVVQVIRQEFSQPIRIERLAAIANMSRSSLHEHFKSVTGMTPLQYQKRLRLLEARQLMMLDSANAARAAYDVGYESASQFSREYSRMFGVSPRRDMAEHR